MNRFFTWSKHFIAQGVKFLQLLCTVDEAMLKDNSFCNIFMSVWALIDCWRSIKKSCQFFLKKQRLCIFPSSSLLWDVADRPFPVTLRHTQCVCIHLFFTIIIVKKFELFNVWKWQEFMVIAFSIWHQCAHFATALVRASLTFFL